MKEKKKNQTDDLLVRKNKNGKYREGITLVALVITIIVLIILAGISINLVLGEDGILKKAIEAREKTEQAQKNEEEMFNTLNDDLQYINEPAGLLFEATKKPSEWSSTKVQPMADGRGGIIPLPNGYFYIGGNVSTGLVISDKKEDTMDAIGIASGNQFVWIPVEGKTKEEREKNFKIDNSGGYSEPAQEGYQYNTELQDYNTMRTSVITYGGFYIGRYEAGINDETNQRTGITAAQEVVSKAGVWPYNYVPWGKSMTDIGNDASPSGAVYLAKNKYSHNDSVESTLVYGVQWFAIRNYIGKEKASMTKPSKQNDLSKTGSYPTEDVAKNIYDLAGNCYEWTMQGYSTNGRTVRGSHYGNSTWNMGVANVPNPSGVSSVKSLGFRMALYIK